MSGYIYKELIIYDEPNKNFIETLNQYKVDLTNENIHYKIFISSNIQYNDIDLSYLKKTNEISYFEDNNIDIVIQKLLPKSNNIIIGYFDELIDDVKLTKLLKQFGNNEDSKLYLCLNIKCIDSKKLLSLTSVFNRILVYYFGNTYSYENNSNELIDENKYISIFNFYNAYLLTRIDYIHRTIFNFLKIGCSKKELNEYIVKSMYSITYIENVLFIQNEDGKTIYSFCDEQQFVKQSNIDLDDKLFEIIDENDEYNIIKSQVNGYDKNKYYLVCNIKKKNINKIKECKYTIQIIFAYFISIIPEIYKYTSNIKQYNNAINIININELSRGVLHDVNNILTSISCNSDILINNCKCKTNLPHIKAIKKGSMDGSDIIKSFIDLNKKDENAIIDINYVLINAIELTSYIWNNPEKLKNIDIKLNLCDDCYAYGKEHEFKESIINLLINASDAIIETGKIYISTKIKNNIIEIRIRDTGCGIDSSIKEKVFETFFTTKGIHGSGIGLSVVKRIINSMNGIITFTSEVNKGTEFLIVLPMAQKKQNITIENKSVNLNNSIKILIIDDKIEISNIVKEMIKIISNIDADVVNDGIIGLKETIKTQYDILIVDYLMPSISGLEIIKKIRENNKTIFIVLMTGFIGNIPSNYNEKIDYILNKPFDINDIRKLIYVYENRT